MYPATHQRTRDKGNDKRREKAERTMESSKKNVEEKWQVSSKSTGKARIRISRKKKWFKSKS